MANITKIYKIVEFVAYQNDAATRSYLRSLSTDNPGDLQFIHETTLFNWVAENFKLRENEAQQLIDSAISEGFLDYHNSANDARTKTKTAGLKVVVNPSKGISLLDRLGWWRIGYYRALLKQESDFVKILVSILIGAIGPLTAWFISNNTTP